MSTRELGKGVDKKGVFRGTDGKIKKRNQIPVVGDLSEPFLKRTLQYGLVWYRVSHADHQPMKIISFSGRRYAVFLYTKALHVFPIQEG